MLSKPQGLGLADFQDGGRARSYRTGSAPCLCFWRQGVSLLPRLISNSRSASLSVRTAGLRSVVFNRRGTGCAWGARAARSPGGLAGANPGMGEPPKCRLPPLGKGMSEEAGDPPAIASLTPPAEGRGTERAAWAAQGQHTRRPQGTSSRSPPRRVPFLTHG
jgi:hypothetical protein